VVDQATTSLSLTSNVTWSETYGSTTNITGWGCPAPLTCNLSRDQAFITNPDIKLLGVGVYNYTYNTSGNANYSADVVTQNLTISQDSSTCGVVFNDTSPMFYGSTLRVWTNCTTASTLYRNSTSIGNNSAHNLAADAYNFTVIRTDTSNYSNSYEERTFVINQSIGEVYAYINNVRNNRSTNLYNSEWLNATLNTGVGNIQLLYNNSLINQGASPLANYTNFTATGNFNVTAFYNGNENYTGDVETWWVNVTIDTVYPQFSNFQENPANTTEYQPSQSYQFNVTVATTNGTVYFSFNNMNYSPTNISDVFTVNINNIAIAAGDYDYWWWGYGNGTSKNFNASSTRAESNFL
jgi:hypothetical protein